MSRIVSSTVALLLLLTPASAQVVTITRIANTTTIVPGGAKTFAAFAPYPSLDGSSVAFVGANNAGSSAIYASSGGTISTLVPPNAPIPNGTGNFSGGYNLGNYQNGTVAFVGGNANEEGIYTSNGTTITRFADLTTTVPNQAGSFTNFYPYPSYSGGTAAFEGTGAGSPGIYASTGGTPPNVIAVADKNTLVPGGTTPLNVAYSAISGSTVVLTGTFATGGGGVYQRTGTGPISTVADSGTPAPDGTGTFSYEFGPPSISGSNVAFFNGNNGVFARINGVLRTIADPGTPSPNGTGTFTGFSNLAYAPISGDEIAFVGYTRTSAGIYLFDGNALHTLVDNTNPIFDGQTLDNNPFNLGPDAIDGNQVAFSVNFYPPISDPAFPTGVYLATFTPVPEPSSLCLFTPVAAATAIVRWRFKRRRSLAS